ncbi:cache domain-containing sensor histidine kinase [Paenibacillus koleovorans]|uniref:cache domain-containing sensor histidine kinase n=1 Tax=Paenibacillus koleovorans TaxID=121608 RepID=UPI000FD84F2F|nr:sensor histidine kinase [Paenibacillus koleovorans]
MRDPLSLWFILKNYRFRSVFIKNFFIILALILLPVTGLSVGIYNLYSKMVTEEISSAHLSSLSRIRDMVDMLVREVDDFSVRLASDEVVADLLETEYEGPPDYDMNMLISKLFAKLNFQNNNIQNFLDSIYVYSEKNQYLYTSDLRRWPFSEYIDREWAADFSKRRETSRVWTIARTAQTHYTVTATKPLITSVRTAPLLYDKSGSIVMNIDTAKFMSIIHNTSDHYLENIYIVDENGLILAHDNFKLINHSITEILPNTQVMNDNPNEPAFVYNEQTKQSVSHVNSLYNKWRFISIVPLKLYEDKAVYIRNYLLVSSFFSVLVALVMSLIVSWRMFIPIKQIMSVVSRPGEWLQESERGSMFQTDKDKPQLNEIKYITSSILSSYGEKQELENELRHRLALLDRAYAVALQSQINPHFLYNTLETINWQALRLSNGDNPVSEMITSLSLLLRFSLDGEDHLVSIRDEMANCQHYIDIQKIRYPRKFVVEWEMDEKLYGLKIPRITLQPLIENAIYHGIKPMNGEGLITVKGSLEGGHAVLRVADNGVGMAPEKVDQINRELADKHWISGNHIGVKNVNQRIKLTFGESSGLHIASYLGKGTEITVRISTLQV